MEMMYRAGAAAVAALLLTTAVPNAVEAAVCKSATVSALGNWSQTFVGARLSARLAWKRKVRVRYGTRYDTWWRAADKSYGCWSDGGRERCRATARPCRFGS
jgi:hypothetical protein